MKVFEMKNELEKVAKVIPKLREELDEVYAAPSGRKTRLKLLWKQYEAKHKELRDSRDHKNLNLH